MQIASQVFVSASAFATSAASAAMPPRAQRLAAVGDCLLQRLQTPLFVTDANGAVLEANAAAMRRIERREGLWLDAGGRLALRQGGRWLPLSQWQALLADSAERVLPLEADGGVPQQITLQRMAGCGGARNDSDGSGNLLLATIERQPLTRTDAMRRRFRFTGTQVRLAEMLCQGMRPTHAAERLGVKISTVRTHVGAMYEKTGTHSQAQLVALLHAV